MHWRRPRAAAFLAAASFAALSCGDSSGPGGLSFQNASLLATRLESIDRAVATQALRGLSGLSIPVHQTGLDVHNMTPSLLGRTLEWSPIHGELLFTDRAGAPVDAIRLTLYITDSTFRPAYPLVEIGYADLYPYNTYNGGGPDSMSMRFVVTDTRGTPKVLADFIAHSHADTSCVQCATVEGWATDGTTRADFRVPYDIPSLGDGHFPGSFTVGSPSLTFQHLSTLPGPGRSTATADLILGFDGDSITAVSGLLRAHAGRLDGDGEMLINGQHFATVTRSATGVTATGPNGRSLTGSELRAVTALFSVPASIAYYIEWPTFVIFFCGCQ